MLYPNQLKNWELESAKASGLNDQKKDPYFNAEPFMIDRSQMLMLEPSPNSSTSFGITSGAKKVISGGLLFVASLGGLFFMDRIEGVDAQLRLPPKVSISSPVETAVEGRDVPIYITVDHMVQDSIDEHSFTMGGTSLQVERLSSQKVAEGAVSDDTDLVTSRFKALLPPKKQGLYKIGPVQVSVHNVTYSSGTINVDVQPAVVSDFLRLEVEIKAPPQIYPGQEVTFEYRIFFKEPIQLFREELPLLNAPGFLNIRSPSVSTNVSDHENVQIIQQAARAIKSGLYEIPSSIIEGMQLETVQDAQLTIPPLYRAEAKPQRIEVLSFPEHEPGDFTGALGSFVWRVIVPDGKVSVNDPISIEYIVSGRGELSTVQFPSLKELAGIDDFFWVSVTPPIGSENDGVKKFILQVRPKFSGKIQVPGFTFCSFDPISQTYAHYSVPPAKITVEGSQKQNQNILALGPSEGDLWPSFNLKESEATHKNISSGMIAYVTIGSILLGFLEWYGKRLVDKNRKVVQTASRELFYKAIMNRGKRTVSLSLLKEAFFLRLFELNLTATLATSQEELFGEGVVQDVKAFLALIDRQLYQKNQGDMSLQELYEEATSLYNVLKGLTRKP